MRVSIEATRLRLPKQPQPVCIACSNTRLFFISTEAGERLVELRDLPDGAVEIAKCGRCRSRNSIVVTGVD
jgi:hypothetical protein